MSSEKKTGYGDKGKALILGRRIALVRKSRGMTQRELARYVNLASAGAINNYEKGRIPRGDILHQIAVALDVTVEELTLATELQVAEKPAPYGDLERSDRRTLDEVADLLRDADKQTKGDLKYEIDKIRRLAKLQKKRA